MAEGTHIVCPRCGTVNRVPSNRPAVRAQCGACHHALFDGTPTEVDQAGFERHVRANDIPVLVDVWAPWCGPCRSMAPMFARAAAALEPEMRLIKLNADEAPDVTARLGVRGIPAMFLFHGGKVLAETAGARDARAIIGWARENLAATSATRSREP